MNTAPAPSGAPDRIPSGYLCYRCSYELGGLPLDGECPECSSPYSFSLAFRGKPHPGQVKLAARIGTPAIIATLSFIVFGILQALRGTVPSDIVTASGCSTMFFGALNLIYLPVVSSTLGQQYVPPHRRRSWPSNMLYLGPWVATAWWLGAAWILCPVAFVGFMILLAIFGLKV